MAQQAMNRNEIVLQVRYILVKYAIDLQKCLFSCSTDIVTVYGTLKKSPRGDLSFQQVISMCRDLKALPGVKDVIFRFDNWTIDSSLTSVSCLEKRSSTNGQEEQHRTPQTTDSPKIQKKCDPFDDFFLT